MFYLYVDDCTVEEELTLALFFFFVVLRYLFIRLACFLLYIRNFYMT